MELGKAFTAVAIEFRVFGFQSKMSFRWPYEDPESLAERELWSYPPGFNRKLRMLFQRVISNRLTNKIHSFRKINGENPYVIVSYPWFLQYLNSELQADNIVYLNGDDYITGYSGLDRIKERQEKEMVLRAGTVLCSSHYQTMSFRQRFPHREKNIFHFPDGVLESFVNPFPDIIKHPNSVVIVGNLTSRVQWQLVYEVVSQLPDIRFVLVGNIKTIKLYGQKTDWYLWLDKVLQLSNIKHEPGGIPYSELPSRYWDNAITWVPYDVNLPFVKASCPAKIVEGLASGRQIISSDIPECRLYPEWISIHRNADEAVALIANAIKNAETPETRQRQRAQIEFARKNTWADRVKKLVEILEHNQATGDQKVSG